MTETASAARDHGRHRLTAVVYLLDLLGAMTVATALVGLAINHARREHMRDTIYASHFDWQMRSVWWALGVSAGGGALIALAELIGMPALGAAGALVVLLTLFWYVYRILKGLMWLSADEPVRGRGR